MTFAKNVEGTSISEKRVTARRRRKRKKTSLVLIYYPFVNAIGIKLPD